LLVQRGFRKERHGVVPRYPSVVIRVAQREPLAVKLLVRALSLHLARDSFKRSSLSLFRVPRAVWLPRECGCLFVFLCGKGREKKEYM